MKLGYKLVISFLIVTVIMGAFGFYMFNSVHSKLSEKQQEINEVTALSSAIQDFHIENFHEQLELWEYAYEPNQKRLNAFYGHLITWEKLYAEFTALAKEAELTTEEDAILTNMEKGVILVRQSWLDFVYATKSVATGTIQSAALNTDGTEKYPLLDEMADYGYKFSYPMFDMATCKASDPVLIAAMVALEDLFDEAEFNKNTDKFVLSQQKKLDVKQAEMEDLKSSLTTQFIIAFIIVLIIAIGLALLMTRAIVKPVNKLTAVANAISTGDMDAKMPEIKSRDEIGELAESFGRMMASIKFMSMDKEE